MFEIGNTLREARLRRGLDIADCEATTKIRAKYLRALEEEHFEVLPGSTYIKGFLRTYAEHLELDGRLVLDEYESRFTGRSDHAHLDAEQAKRRARRRRGREGRVLLTAASLVLVAAVGLWVGFADDKAPAPAPQSARLDLVFAPASSRDAYVEVRQGGPEGALLFTPVTMKPGQSRQVAGTPPIWVHVGDGAELRLLVNERTVTTPAGKTEFRILTGGEIQSTR